LYRGGVTKEGTAEWPVRIRSPRLVIRPPGDADRAAMIRLMTDPVTREYLGGAVDYASRQALELSPLGLTWGRWVLALADDDTMIGSITLDYDRGELELSYALLPERTGQGYAAESCIALLDWARHELEDEVVIAISQTRNKRSVALLRKLGFTVRKGLEEFGTQQLLLERSLREPLPAQESTLQTAEDPPPPTRR
jgi:ribosomal-protein-alanine N-acetyltransferase